MGHHSHGLLFSPGPCYGCAMSLQYNIKGLPWSRIESKLSCMHAHGRHIHCKHLRTAPFKYNTLNSLSPLSKICQCACVKWPSVKAAKSVTPSRFNVLLSIIIQSRVPQNINVSPLTVPLSKRDSWDGPSKSAQLFACVTLVCTGRASTPWKPRHQGSFCRQRSKPSVTSVWYRPWLKSPIKFP